MKRLIGALSVSVASVVLFAGCVPITYTRSVTVTKDGSGAITSIVEHEAITEPHSETPKIKEVQGSTTFKHLK